MTMNSITSAVQATIFSAATVQQKCCSVGVETVGTRTRASFKPPSSPQASPAPIAQSPSEPPTKESEAVSEVRASEKPAAPKTTLPYRPLTTEGRVGELLRYFVGLAKDRGSESPILDGSEDAFDFIVKAKKVSEEERARCIIDLAKEEVDLALACDRDQFLERAEHYLQRTCKSEVLSSAAKSEVMNFLEGKVYSYFEQGCRSMAEIEAAWAEAKAWTERIIDGATRKRSSSRPASRQPQRSYQPRPQEQSFEPAKRTNEPKRTVSKEDQRIEEIVSLRNKYAQAGAIDYQGSDPVVLEWSKEYEALGKELADILNARAARPEQAKAERIKSAAASAEASRALSPSMVQKPGEAKRAHKAKMAAKNKEGKKSDKKQQGKRQQRAA